MKSIYAANGYIRTAWCRGISWTEKVENHPETQWWPRNAIKFLDTVEPITYKTTNQPNRIVLGRKMRIKIKTYEDFRSLFLGDFKC
jgi:hypothetical protein